MEKKYFAAFCKMNNRDLRSNFFEHACLVFFECDCDESHYPIMPLKLIDAYGFYSHNMPTAPTFFGSPLAYFAYQAGLTYRLGGSYGEWRREKIHDLTLGLGLTGKLFEVAETRFSTMITHITNKIAAQQSTLSSDTRVQVRESRYQQHIMMIANHLYFQNHRISYDVAIATAKTVSAISEFRLSLFQRSQNCKTQALSLLESAYDTDRDKGIIRHIRAMGGNTILSAIPVMTTGLKPITVHAATNEWEILGNHSRYPFLPWEKVQNGNAYVIDFSGEYVGLDGKIKTVPKKDSGTLTIIRDLKMLSRLCAVNITTSELQTTLQQIDIVLHNITVSANKQQEYAHRETAKELLYNKINNNAFTNTVKAKTPNNLIPYLSELLSNYEYRPDTDNEYDSDDSVDSTDSDLEFRLC